MEKRQSVSRTRTLFPNPSHTPISSKLKKILLNNLTVGKIFHIYVLKFKKIKSIYLVFILYKCYYKV